MWNSPLSTSGYATLRERKIQVFSRDGHTPHCLSFMDTSCVNVFMTTFWHQYLFLHASETQSVLSGQSAGTNAMLPVAFTTTAALASIKFMFPYKPSCSLWPRSARPRHLSEAHVGPTCATKNSSTDRLAKACVAGGQIRACSAPPQMPTSSVLF